MKNAQNRDNWKIAYILAMLLGAICFLGIYGWYVLNPLYTDWLLLGGDLKQHYLGWEYYRRGAWTFPIGLTDQLAYPNATSVIFTDSIPLFAVSFKLINGFLPEYFQYMGLWGLLSFMLQGLLTVMLLKEFRLTKVQALLTCPLLIVAPTVIEKMFRHTSLGGQWIILCALLLYVKHRDEYQDVKKTSMKWGLLGLLIASVHLYFLPMCGMILGGYILCSFGKEKRIAVKYVLPGITFMVGIVGNTFLLGGFVSGNGGMGDGLGECSFNLNGFFNAKGYSRFFPSLKMCYDWQYEGFAYLGLGAFILLAFSLMYIIAISIKRNNEIKKDYVLYGGIAVLVAMGLIAFAASPKVTFGDKLLFEWPDIDIIIKYWSYFRSSGRIIWPVCYMLDILAIVGTVRFCDRYVKSKQVGILILGMCVALQFVDLSERLSYQHDSFDQVVMYESTLENEIWDKLQEYEGVEHVVWAARYWDNSQIMELATYALKNHMTMNAFYFARYLDVWEDTQNFYLQNKNDSCVYVSKIEEIDELKQQGLYVYEAGDFAVGTTFLIK